METTTDPARAAHLATSIEREKACDFGGAAIAALAGGEPRRAAWLAALAGDATVLGTAIDQIATGLDEAAARAVAVDLKVRGFPEHAGTLLARIGADVLAAEAFVAAGDPASAASAYGRAGKPADAARVLESALRASPSETRLRVALGELLARHGRTEAAVRALQAVPHDAPERARALPLLRRCLGELGLEEACHAVEGEMRSLGIPFDEPAPISVQPGARAQLFGRYEVVRQVAETPHARVVEAVDRVTSERVAIKRFVAASDDAGRDALARFEREARALAMMRHPNIVAIRAYHPEGPAIVLPWMSGGSLADRMRAGDHAPARAVELACAVLAALGEAHRLGILHRDVKPSNVLFDDAGVAHLGDFGAAHVSDRATTATAGAFGTLAYMSPEQRLGRPATLASDLYGVGAMLVELLTGKVPEPTDDDTISPAPSAVHPDLATDHDAVCARLVRRVPEERPETAFEAKRLLTSLAWSERTAPTARRASLPPRSRRSGPPPTAGRLVLAADPAYGSFSRWHDTWLERDVVVVPWEAPLLAFVGAFARAGHPALPTVLRANAEDEALWVAPPLGESLRDLGKRLDRATRERLRGAVDALHAAGGAHGSLDADHVWFFAGEATLAFPREVADEPLSHLVERDAAAMAQLFGTHGAT